MSNTIAINDILDANAHNSSMALTAAWSEVFRKYAMEDYESLSDDPASSFNIFMHLTAQGAAKMMYEQAARITETNVSTAILPKSLLNKLSAEELQGIFGTPASTTIAFCIKKDEIINYSVSIPEENVFRLVVNKNLQVVFESHPPFTLPYNVNINCKPIVSNTVNPDTGAIEQITQYNIYAYYDMPPMDADGMRSIFGIQNQYISSREMRFEGETYIAFFLKVFQIERKEVEFYITNPYTADTTLNFNNLLVGVEVFRKKPNTTEKILMKGFTEGTSLIQNSYNYSYDYKRNSQNFNLIFSKMSDSSALSVGDTIYATVYTTLGEVGNIEFPYMIYNINNLSVVYNQDLNDAAQNAIISIIALAFARDEAAVGGKNALSFEEIRQNIINKNYSREVLISNSEIINSGTRLGLNVSQLQQDLTAMYYRSSDKLTYKNMILSTGTSTFYFDLKKKNKLLSGYNYYMIEPTDVFRYNPNNNRFEYTSGDSADDSVESYNEYVNKYNTAQDKDAALQVCFPFHLRYENTANPKIQVYDMYVKATEFLKFTEYNEVSALDKLDITYIRVVRNPFKGSVNGAFDKNEANKYYVNFIVHTGENTLNKLYLQAHDPDFTKNYVNSMDADVYANQYVTFEVAMRGINSGSRYVIDPTKVQILNVETMVKDGYIAYQATFETNNFISDDKEMQLKGIRNAGSITKDYTTFMPVDTTVEFSITGTFNDAENNPTKKHCIVYESDSIPLVNYLKDNFKIDFDIESYLPGYVTYDADRFELYRKPVYYKNQSYDPTVKDKNNVNHYESLVEVESDGVTVKQRMIGNTSTPIYRVAHQVGEIAYTYSEISAKEYASGPEPLKEYCIRTVEKTFGDGSKQYFKDENDEYVYEVAQNLTSFDPNEKYYTRHATVRHKKGDLILYDKHSGDEIDLPYSEAAGNINAISKSLPTEYIGICKNVPWINRLYMAGEYMYENIHSLYTDIIDRTNMIIRNLFDGGKMFVALNFTSGRSNKFKAFKLSSGGNEYLNDIAMSFTFRVKYSDDSSLEYKEDAIKTAVMKYISELGDSDLSVDKMFDSIKSAVPDIVYINIEKMNNYRYGEVQTILNDKTVTDEVLTVSQKIVTTETGDIDFVPDITVNVVQE